MSEQDTVTEPGPAPDSFNASSDGEPSQESFQRELPLEGSLGESTEVEEESSDSTESPAEEVVAAKQGSSTAENPELTETPAEEELEQQPEEQGSVSEAGDLEEAARGEDLAEVELLAPQPEPRSPFEELGLSGPILKAIEGAGYEAPSAIQSGVVPFLLEGRDVVGQAQTGTGKTGAFAWPLLQRLDIQNRRPQAMVLAPTRELAIQVAEAFKRYAVHMPGFRVLPIYGGQAYHLQLRPLREGVHVVVGTPGRVMDHMRRGSLALDAMETLVLDEADEMLRMGFIDDVKWILEQLPEKRRTALFSATMPPVIRSIAKKHLTNPKEVTFRLKTATASTIEQRFRVVDQNQKLPALTRLLEIEEFDGMIVFVRTRIGTTQVAEALEANGYASAALSGELQQSQRERVIERFKAGRLDILVATDVAARGLDVERISHVVNLDIPYDAEAYVHRIGRTGRAGREGKAILFVTPREKRMLRTIERAIRTPIEPMRLPSADEVRAHRVDRFKARVTEALAGKDAAFFQEIVTSYASETNTPIDEVAAALASMAQGDRPLNEKVKDIFEPHQNRGRDFGDDNRRGGRFDQRQGRNQRFEREDRGGPVPAPQHGQQRYRIEVGHRHGVRPAQIVGAITGEAELNGKHIGRIEIYQRFSTVDLPEGMPREIFNALQKTRVSGQPLALSKLSDEGTPSRGFQKNFKGKGGPRKHFKR